MITDLENHHKIYKSVKNRKWAQTPFDQKLALSIAQKKDLPHMLSEMLSSRNIGVDHIDSFLEPKLKDLLPDPFHLLDMKKAVEAATRAISQKKKIVVFGDYDVDGATSSALLIRYFAQIGVTIEAYIPDRLLEGYGPNVIAFQTLKDQGTDLIITVDCGTQSIEPIALAKQLGMEVIVLDHHIGSEQMPEAAAIVNPNRFDEISDFKYLAAVGICFLFVIALTKHLKNNDQIITEPNLIQLLDIVALGTICDQVPLVGLNRAFVRQGLKIINSKQNIGLCALMEVAGIAHEHITTYHLGFAIGPRINAGGRVGKASLGTQILASNDAAEAKDIATLLNNYNEERKAIEFVVLAEAIEQAEQLPKSDPIIFVASAGWHAGVIGIIASRLKEKFNKPVAVISLENDIGKASCRSIAGIDFGAAVISAKSSGLLIAGGGHSMAAGFTVATDKIAKLKDFFCKNFLATFDELSANSLSHFDAHLTLSSTNIDLVNQIEKLGPFGSGNFQPRFMISGASIIRANVVGGEHISCIIGEGKGGNCRIKAIAFRALNSPMSEVLLSSKNFNLTLIVNLNVNRWQGNETAEMVIHDLIISDFP